MSSGRSRRSRERRRRYSSERVDHSISGIVARSRWIPSLSLLEVGSTFGLLGNPVSSRDSSHEPIEDYVRQFVNMSREEMTCAGDDVKLFRRA